MNQILLCQMYIGKPVEELPTPAIIADADGHIAVLLGAAMVLEADSIEPLCGFSIFLEGKQ